MEGQGYGAQETKQEESIGHWKYDKMPDEKERFQPLKTVKPVHLSATVDQATVLCQGQAGDPRRPRVSLPGEDIKTSSQSNPRCRAVYDMLNKAFNPELLVRTIKEG